MKILTSRPDQHVAVVTGGWSQERDRSLASATAVMGALQDLGFPYKLIDLEEDRETLAADLGGCDVAFLAIAGQGAEDGQLQGYLETLGIPYTGSGVLASSLGMHKITAKEVVGKAVFTALDYKISSAESVEHEVTIVEEEFNYPVIVKPLSEGGSIGLALAGSRAELTAALAAGVGTGELMVEQYVKGMSVSVGVLDGAEGPVALSPLETEAPGGIYSYEAKRVAGQTEYHCPARLPELALRDLQRSAVKAHEVLGCSGYSRHDFVVTPARDLYWLEVNTLPGLTRVGNLARMAEADGISYTQLISHILATARVGRPAVTLGSAA
ncbi:D-alanine--D-alanine ligase [Streptomyces brevispora]|uniref:D-alanine--D-alanine ligase family protein n=1 Tax=Streptomyces brevispora TaxID=887462 RepID=UPI00371522FD